MTDAAAPAAAPTGDDVERFLENTRAAEGRELAVAIACARAMAAELGASAAQWQAAAARLESMRRYPGAATN